MITYEGWVATVNIFLMSYLGKQVKELPVPESWWKCWFEHRVKAQPLAELLYAVDWEGCWYAPA